MVLLVARYRQAVVVLLYVSQKPVVACSVIQNVYIQRKEALSLWYRASRMSRLECRRKPATISRNYFSVCTDHCGGVEPSHLCSCSRLENIDKNGEHVMNQLGMRAKFAALSRICHLRLRDHTVPSHYVFNSLNCSRIRALHHKPHHHVQLTLKESQRRVYHANHEDSTIYALSTAPGKAAIAVIRISGPACNQVGDPRPTMSCRRAKC